MRTMGVLSNIHLVRACGWTSFAIARAWGYRGWRNLWFCCPVRGSCESMTPDIANVALAVITLFVLVRW
jgi:hypothetical protein